MTGVPRLVFRLLLDGRVPLRLKLILPAALAYLISPFDVLPDLIVPGLGHVDDLLVILAALGLFLGMAPREVVAGTPGQGRAGRNAPAWRPAGEGHRRLVQVRRRGRRGPAQGITTLLWTSA